MTPVNIKTEVKQTVPRQSVVVIIVGRIKTSPLLQVNSIFFLKMVLRSVLLASALCLLTTCRLSFGLPMQITVNQRQPECLYEILNQG